MIKFGPSYFRDHEDRELSVTSFGPITATGDFTVGSMKSFGPLIVHGNLDAEVVSTFGPLIAHQDVDVYSLRTNGPAQIKGNCKVDRARINGPLHVRHLVSNEVVRINGPVNAESLKGRVIKINGPVDVVGEIEASEVVAINLGYTKREDILKSKMIKAPLVRISRLQPNFLRGLLSKLFGLKFQNQAVPEIDIPIEADEVILNGVSHVGKLVAGKVILLNGANYNKLLE